MESIMNIPNSLTIIRFILIPIFIYSFYTSTDYRISFLIFIFAGITDVLDGFIARRYNKITKLGILLDPLADKALQLSVLYVLTDKNMIPIWIIAVFVLKEAFLIIGGGFVYKRKVIIEAKWYGKFTTVMFYIAIILIVFINKLWGIYALILVLIAAIYSAIRYLTLYLGIRKEIVKK